MENIIESVMKTPALYILGLIAISVGMVLCMLWALPGLIKRGVDVSGIIEKANITVAALDTVADLAKQLFPSAPMGVVDKILHYAQEAVRSAEQMYKAGTLEESARKAAATELIYQFAKSAGIEVTDELKPVIDGAIEAAVWMLPKTHE